MSISCARRSGDAFHARSGYGIRVNEAAPGPAAGEDTFDGVRFSGNATNVQNTTSTFTLHLTESTGGVPATTVPTTAPPVAVDLAAGRPVTESGHAEAYGAANVVDGNALTYWEGPNGLFPASVTVDPGSARRIGRVTFALPPAAAWQAREQRITVLGSAYNALAAEKAYRFDPARGNTAAAPTPRAR